MTPPEGRLPRRLAVAFALLGAGLLLTVVAVVVDEHGTQWRDWRARFEALPQNGGGVHLEAGIQQIWLPELGRVDRCTTCHLGSDDPALAEAAQPFRAHSGDWLETHPAARHGCTACHGGQGAATTFDGAAHHPIPHWPEPVRSAAHMEAHCGRCHQEREPQRAPLLAAGRAAIAESNCAGCHDLPGFSEDEVRAPDISGLGDKLQPGFLHRWLRDPSAWLERSRMPDFRLEEEEVADLEAFLLEQRGPGVPEPSVDWSGADPDAGGALFRTSRCVTCHAVNGRGGTVGPELTRVGSKATRAWLLAYLSEPHRYQPDTLMPHFRFERSDLLDLAAYLSTELVDFGASEQAETSGDGDPEEGQEIFLRRGCHGCHSLPELPERPRIGPSLATLGERPLDAVQLENKGIAAALPNWIFTKLRQPETLSVNPRMPSFGFSESEAAAITLAVASLDGWRPPEEWITREDAPAVYAPGGEFGALVRRYRCLSCHSVGGFGGTLSTVSLDVIGSQLQRGHIEAFLRNPVAVRVSVQERMPRLGVTPDEARLLAQHLTSVFRDDALETPVPAAPSDVARGKSLYKEFGCRGCHIIGGQGGYVGPDLSAAGSRLQPGWVVAWMLEPERWKPGTLQPDYALERDEAQALAAYVMSLKTPAGGAR